MSSFGGLTAKQIEARLKNGRGEGSLQNYKPFITVRNVSSLGRSHRVLCSSPHATYLIDINDPKAFPTLHDNSERLLRQLAVRDTEITTDPYLALTMTLIEADSKAEEIRNRG